MKIRRWNVRFLADDALERAVYKETPGTLAYDIVRTELLRRKAQPPGISAVTVLIVALLGTVASAVILNVFGS